MEKVLARREWLAGSFSVADILMADVLHLVDRFDGLAGYPACRDYVARATARPSFVSSEVGYAPKADMARAACKIR
jgi:glutathione S-transferase